jgi:hypothetical protein
MTIRFIQTEVQQNCQYNKSERVILLLLLRQNSEKDVLTFELKYLKITLRHDMCSMDQTESNISTIYLLCLFFYYFCVRYNIFFIAIGIPTL